ncbi:hypothetical protein P8C59_007194 [Phyllachora maydis]|uniref:Uncharacterized protein n=1 Tax=Phyllachora maydis TaxID=1825666 RepID=A0AAD9I918_9PEZI|nr:hypothetical protein P8C59_007194 [Phyllachora maydis]
MGRTHSGINAMLSPHPIAPSTRPSTPSSYALSRRAASHHSVQMALALPSSESVQRSDGSVEGPPPQRQQQQKCRGFGHMWLMIPSSGPVLVMRRGRADDDGADSTPKSVSKSMSESASASSAVIWWQDRVDGQQARGSPPGSGVPSRSVVGPPWRTGSAERRHSLPRPYGASLDG